MRILFALPGLHRYDRGAEVAFISLAKELCKAGDLVTLIGSGPGRPGTPYRFIRASSIARERFEHLPTIPILRNESAYEEATFVPALLWRYRPADYDITATCSYPFTNWALRRPRFGGRPPHVFITQNGDWAARARNAEYRLFGCEGLVCTNPEFFELNKERWRCSLIPNGIDLGRFCPGEPERLRFGIPLDGFVVLIVSALIASKRVSDAVKAVSRIPGAIAVVAGDGPLRDQVDELAAELLPGRFRRLTLASDDMPSLYRSADVFLHLSKEESFGNVFLEAMACGLPIVGHDSPRVRWIVGSDECLLDTTDIGAVATMIEEARRSPVTRRDVRSARAAAFAWPKIAAQYRAFFHEVISERGAAFQH